MVNIYIYLLRDDAHVMSISHTGQLQMDGCLIANIGDGDSKLWEIKLLFFWIRHTDLSEEPKTVQCFVYFV